ncbi:MAG: VWA domain-containing protein, partial [Alphaproteobacteria bacterium]
MADSERGDVAPKASSAGDIDAFLQKVRKGPQGPVGRLIFALDATQSRQSTWDQASNLQAEMFKEAASLGGLAIQLVFYRGFGECKASGWSSNGDDLLRRMLRVQCEGGLTQIGKVLTNAKRQAESGPVAALVFVGDAFEEDIDRVCHKAGELGLLGVPVLMFQEGDDAAASQAFAQIAKLTGGAHCKFDLASA